MKTKKAVKRLDKVVAILSDIIKQYAPTERHVRDLLGAAKASVDRAKTAVSSPASKTAPKAPATAKRVVANKAKQGGPKATARKKLPAPAKKKLRTPARRKGVRAVKSVAATARHSRAIASGEPVAKIFAPAQDVHDRDANSVSESTQASETTVDGVS
jgi:hypothetical protein